MFSFLKPSRRDRTDVSSEWIDDLRSAGLVSGHAHSRQQQLHSSACGISLGYLKQLLQVSSFHKDASAESVVKALVSSKSSRRVLLPDSLWDPWVASITEMPSYGRWASTHAMGACMHAMPVSHPVIRSSQAECALVA